MQPYATACAGAWSAQGAHAVAGTLWNFNTQEGFTKTDLKGHMKQVGGPDPGRLFDRR